MPFERILFPTDFSGPCDQMASSVAAVQQVMGASLTLLHAIERREICFGNDLPDLATLREAAAQRLGQFSRQHFAGEQSTNPPELELQEGDAAQVIALCVEAQQIDLVMMPTHGYGAFRRTLLGSVTTKVLHDLNCAVWTAVHVENMPATAVKHVICGIDEPETSADLLRSAAAIAGRFGATLRIVHAYPDFAGTPDERYARALPLNAESSIRNKMEALQERAGVSVPVVIARGEVNEVIAETATRGDADLVIAGRGSFGGFLVSIRSHLYYIVRSSPCPVLVLPEY